MTFLLNEIVPWGRSYLEYVRMFALSEADLQKKNLGVGDGPASFNKTLHEQGKRIVSVDPIYHFSTEDIRKRIEETCDCVMEQLYENQEDFVWNHIASPKDLRRMRMDAMNAFLSDFEIGKKEGRYLNASLPVLPFADNSFDIALCSHFLFLYGDHLSEEFHLDSVEEMLRVSTEVRIFPLLDLSGEPSKYIDAVSKELLAADCRVSLERVNYEFQRGGHTMMKIYKAG